MAFYKCVVDALKAGRVTEKMFKSFEDRLRQHELNFNAKTDLETPAARKVLEEAIANVGEIVALKKKQLILAVAARERNEAYIAAKGTIRPVKALMDTLQHVQDRGETIKAQWAAPMADFFQRFAKGNVLGNFLRKMTDRDKFGMEMMQPGSSKSGLHAKLAKAVQTVLNDSVVRRADAGMDIRLRKNYGLQTRHDGVAINKAGFEKWADSIRQNVKTINGETLTNVKNLKEVLMEIFHDVRSEHAGLGAADPSSQRRVFGFGDDYAGWKAYNKDFGMSAGDPVEAVRLQINHAASQAAMVEQFGPHPSSMIQHLKNFSMEQANKLNDKDTGPGGTNWASRKALKDMQDFEGIYREMTEPDSPLSTAASIYQGARSLVYSTIAQTAYLSQLPMDLLSRIPTLKMINNLPASVMTNSIIKYIPSLVGDESRQMAIRAGVGGAHIFNELRKGNDALLREHPIMGRVMSINEPIARAFLVHGHMETLPRMLGMEFLTNFHAWKGMKFDELPIVESMKRNGITEHDWNMFRKTDSLEHSNGLKTLNPVDMLKRDDLPREQLRDVATRIGMYVNGEARESVPAANLSNHYALTGRMDKNSIAGMIVQDATVAMHFAMSTLMMLHRGFMLRQGLASKASFAAVAGLSLLGANALRMQSKAILAGRDPYNMNPASEMGRKFWSENLLTSGFAGPSIDLALGGRKGAVAQIASNTFDAIKEESNYLTSNNAKDPHFALKMFQIGRQFVPGAKGWYTQLLVSNTMLDSLARDIDSEAYKKQSNLDNYYRKTWRQDSWFGHQTGAVTRGPDMSKAFQGN